MPISDAESVKFGLLVMYAEDMYVSGETKPNSEPRIAQAGWETIAHLAAKDAILPKRESLRARQKKLLGFGDVVFYGLLARSVADLSLYAVAIRGTEGFAEWIIDADFLLIPNSREPGAKVEQGFWSIYESMSLVDVHGNVIDGFPADRIANIVRDGHVTVTGHSLGSALATYLSLEIAKHPGPQVSACLFASPRTGDAAWANLYDKTVGDYRLFNYVLDAVPYVPFDVPPEIHYSTLSKATIIQPSTAQADIRLDIGCDHHILCYCAMLGYGYTKASLLPPEDQQLWSLCVIGPQEMSANAEFARILADAVHELGDAEQIVELLKRKLHWTGDA